MSYLVLARKWRPQTFGEIVGQDHVSATLSKAVEKGRLAHAYLFTGPRGCGKTTTARILSKIINCENPQNGEPCNSCDSCVAVNSGEHLDVIEIDGASNRGIDEIRDLREKIGYASSRGKAKIYIIDEVHMLTPQAFNALLKTLEEPPEHVYMILATTEPHKVPATIRSRCQRFDFKRLELEEISGQLEKICRSEKIEFDRDALILISRRADGSMRDAESLLDQCISAAEGKIDIPLVRGVLGLVDSRVVIDLLKSVGARKRKEALGIVDGVVSSGLDLEEFFLAYMEGLRNLLVISEGGTESAGWLDLTPSEFTELRAISESFRTEDLLMLFREAVRSFREFKLSGQPRYHLEAMVIEAASWDSAVEISDLMESPESGKIPDSVSLRKAGRLGEDRDSKEERQKGLSGSSGKTGEAAVNKAAKGFPAGASDQKKTAGTGMRRSADTGGGAVSAGGGGGDAHSEGAVSLLGGSEEWERFLSRIREAKLTLGIWLNSARVQEVDGSRLVLGFSSSNKFAREMIREAKNKKYIENHLESFFGRKFAIEVVETERPGGIADKVRKPGKKKKRERKGNKDPRLESLPDDEPVLKKIVKEFEGEIFDG